MGLAVVIAMAVTFDSTISLGSMVHAALMIIVILGVFYGIHKLLKRMEKKQDEIIATLSSEDAKQ